MKWLKEKFQFKGLFIKMFSVTLISVITVALLTWLVMLQMSEKVFMDTFSITNSKIMTQIQTSLENMNYAVSMTASNANSSGEIKRFLTVNNETTIEALRSHYLVTNEMNRLQSTVATYPITMMITGMNGYRHSTDSAFWPLTYMDMNDDPITIDTLKEPRKLQYHLDRRSLTAQNDKVVIVTTKALMDRSSGLLYGTLYFAMQESEFKKSYTGFTTVGNDVLLLDQDGLVMSSNRNSLIGTNERQLLSEVVEMNTNGSNVIEVEWEGKQHLLIAKYLPTYDLFIVNTVDKRAALSQMMNFKVVAVICALIVCIALFIVFIITHRITKSLTLLARQMSRITKRNFGNYFTVSGSYEVRELGNAYNYMLDELNDYISQLIKTQKDQRNAELSALQMQINPHFLYNTLASVKILVQQGNKEKATLTINALIELLQNTIGNASETISVEEELVNLKNYVLINHIRYGEQINVSYFIDDNCKEYQLPKLIIQPFIENAFFHAFRGRNDGYIYVMISREGSNLVCEIVDNGIGMDLKQNSEQKSTRHSSHFFSGIGIRNVNDRLELLYGDNYGVKIISSPDQGTRIIINMPIMMPQKNTKI
ncbi:cache domain-containing sensor histidine kinase [Paenibacillus endoradicis]|uniref:cache domain-containing sensor histidine kinase n=1 Tax=Paenibacillus endoradicis TaxID=2972487 RepID=UPI002158A650|nr:sensor histidine kinase [Paenibacillus endoradicis]MCR8660245.1 sensor histidine kinase [Paenibacillus endoradicis]